MSTIDADAIERALLAEIAAAADPEALEAVRVAALGRRGALTEQMKGLGALDPEARRQAQNELIAEAIDAFKARAEIVKAALSGRNFKLLRLNVASGYAGPQPRFAMARAAPGSDAEVAPPSLEGGVSMITVSVNGAIEITRRTE